MIPKLIQKINPTSSQGSEKKLPGKPKVKSEAQMRLEKQLKK